VKLSYSVIIFFVVVTWDIKNYFKPNLIVE
jgi:hypothetical protein